MDETMLPGRPVRLRTCALRILAATFVLTAAWGLAYAGQDFESPLVESSSKASVAVSCSWKKTLSVITNNKGPRVTIECVNGNHDVSVLVNNN
jgi:hypothetical protein